MDKKLFALITLFFISFAFFAILTVFYKPITQFTRAKEDAIASAERSKIIAWPLALKADGTQQSVINIFIVSESDKPLSNKVVNLITSLGQLKDSQVTTDNGGKATFYLTSTTPGIAEIEASISPNVKLIKKISVKFE